MSKVSITPEARRFLEPENATHRQYEALRAFFVDGLKSAEAAERFGYSVGSFRVMCHEFRRNPGRQFFVAPQKGPHKTPERSKLREQIVTLRKQNLSIYDIGDALAAEGKKCSRAAVASILKKEGFARLPRRRDEERPTGPQPDPAAVADVRELNLTPRRIHTKYGGLFLFVPFLVSAGFDKIMSKSGLPGSKMVPAACAMRSLLGLKLFGNARHSHVMSHVFDQGLALFDGLNVVPKRSFLTEYSARIDPAVYPRLMRLWFNAVGKLGLERGVSFDLDFHTIPFHGDDALVQRHYVSKRSRKQKGLLGFLAQDADKRVFCYANAEIRKEDQNDEILRFVEFWRKRTGRLPEELVFDSKLTTYTNLNHLNKKNIHFITLRRRSRKMVEEIAAQPRSAWRRVELEGVSRIYRHPRVLDREVTLKDYEGPIRQLTVTELGHEEPTLLLTNQMKRSARKLIERYAHRMLIENGIADGIDFFHMDALSSAVAMKVNCDLQLTLMASSLYRLLGAKLGNGYADAKSRHIFQNFIDATADIEITNETINVLFQKRAHNPFLLAAGFQDTDLRVPWWRGRRLRFIFR